MSRKPSARPRSNTADQNLAAQFQRTFQMMIRRTSRRSLQILYESGLTLPQLLTLHRLEHGPASVTDVARHLNLSCGAVSHLIDRLVHEGFVHRDENQEDRRHKRISISDHGRRFLFDLERSRRNELSETLGELPAEMKARLDAILKDIGELLASLPLPEPRSDNL